MAKNKPVDEAVIREAALEEVAELEEELKEAKELEAEIEAEEPAEEKPKAKSKAKEETEELVSIMIPMIEGEDPEVTVGINGVFTKIRRGVRVEVKPEVAELLENSNLQMMAALKKQKELEDQKFDW